MSAGILAVLCEETASSNPIIHPWAMQNNCLTSRLLHRTRVGLFMATWLHPSNTQRPLSWTLTLLFQHKPSSLHPQPPLKNPSQSLQKTPGQCLRTGVLNGPCPAYCSDLLFMYTAFTLCVFVPLIASFLVNQYTLLVTSPCSIHWPLDQVIAVYASCGKDSVGPPTYEPCQCLTPSLPFLLQMHHCHCMYTRPQHTYIFLNGILSSSSSCHRICFNECCILHILFFLHSICTMYTGIYNSSFCY